MSTAKVLTTKKGFLMVIDRHYSIEQLREFSKQLEDATGEKWTLICDASYVEPGILTFKNSIGVEEWKRIKKEME